MSLNNPDSKKPLYLLLLVVIFAATYAYTFDSKVAMLGDNANYYTLGKAISQGEGYVNISRINKSPNNHYPPGYPTIISGVLLLGGGIFSVKLLNGLFLLAGVVVFFELMIKLLNNVALSFVICLMIVLNAHLLLYSSIMMSEVPFLFFSGLSLLLFTRSNTESPSIKDLNLIGSIITLIIAYYIRSLGVVLLAGYVLHFFFNKQWKAIPYYTVGLIAGAAPWFIRGQKLGGSSYMNQLTMINPYQPSLGRADLGDFVDRFFANLDRYITWEIPSAMFPAKQPDYGGASTGGEWLVGLVLVFLLCLGIYHLKNYRWVIIGYVLGTFGIVMLWPSVWVGVRFIVPLIPVLFLGLFNGLYYLISKISEASSSKKLSPLLLVVFALLSISPINAQNDQAKTPYTSAWKNYFKIADWAKSNLDNGVVISCGKPALFYLHAETYTMRYKFAQNPAQLIQDLEDQKVDYVVVDQVYGNTFRYLVPAIRQYPERFQQVLHLKNPDTYLLKFKK